MADAPKILETDSLRVAYPKLNSAIDNSNEALTKATGADGKADSAISTANTAKTTAESVQEQFNQVVIEGDSSVEAAQARVDAGGNSFTTLKERLDTEHTSVTTQLAQKVQVSNFDSYKGQVANELDYINTIHFKNKNNGGYSWWVYPNVYRPSAPSFDKTYFSFVNSQAQTVVASLNNDTGKYESFVLQTDVADEHNTAAITLNRSNNRILVAYSKHSSENRIYIRESVNPEDITSFKAPIVLDSAGKVTYAQLIYLRGEYHLFYRSQWISWMYRRSSDGITWGPEREIARASDQYYMRIIQSRNSANEDTIKFMLVGHPINSTDRNLRYGSIDLNNGDVLTIFVAGQNNNLGNVRTGAGLPIANTSYQKILDTDALNKNVRLLDFAVQVKQADVGACFAYAEFTNATDAVYKVQKSMGGGVYRTAQVCKAGLPIEEPAGSNYYFGGAWFEFDNDKKIYIAREQDGTWFIESYVTDDYSSWRIFERIDVSRKQKLHRPTTEYGYGNKLYYTKGLYTNYENYSTFVNSK